MKTSILFLLLVCLITNCKKNDDSASLNPDFTVGLTGSYAIILYREGSQSITLPTSTSSGVFEISKIDLTHARAKLTMTMGGNSNVWSTNDFELKRDASNPNLYAMYISGQTVGTITATAMEVNATSPDGTVTQIKAKR